MNMVLNNLKIGDFSDNGQVTIIAEDKLCFQVLSANKGAKGIRTISKALLTEFINYLNEHPDTTPREARIALTGSSEIDRYEYGYDSTLLLMAKMVLGKENVNHTTKGNTVLFAIKDPTDFVWECIKFLNKQKNLYQLLKSKYSQTTQGFSSEYLVINECYASMFGRSDNYEYIQISDGKYLNREFDARNITNFAKAINDVYKNLYRIDIEQENKKTIYKLISIEGVSTSYLPYLTALRTKPFMLLAGISGTGKSRIVREMAKACWTPDEDEYGKNCPRNFCMVQVKPNWHDSSDLIGYVSRINGEKYVVGPFLRFIAKAIKDPKRPYFLCLDEMNLAPVEQYFAEYLSVIESRKLQDGQIETDPIVPYENTEAYGSLIDQLFDSDEERKAYKTEEGGKRLTIPENLFVVGTVNMDETTFSFSRKVLDRAMTIEMNEVDLKGGLEAGGSAEFGYIGEDLMGDAAEGKDIYADNQALCDDIITYLGKVNEILEGTPFKIAYRTRNEFLLYAVNRLHFATDSELWQTLDEMTSMKILSRIEGDNERCERVLREMKQLLTETVGEHASDSVSLKKIDEMTFKLKSGYTSYWA